MRKIILIPALSIFVLTLLCSCTPPPDLAPIRLAEHNREVDSSVLKDALAGGSSTEKIAAATAMGRIQSSSYAAPLAAALGDTDSDVRDAAVFALGQFGMVKNVPEKAVAAIRDLLSSDDAVLLALAVEALGKLAPPDGPELLSPLLTHDAARVREEAAHAMMRWRFTPIWRGEAEEPAAWPDAGSAALSRSLEDPEAAVRIAAAHAFSRYGDARVLEQLAGRRDDEDALVRLFAVRAVGRSGEPSAADSVGWGLTDANPGVRAETVQAIGTLDRQELLIAALTGDASFHVRANLAQVLGTARGGTSLQFLRKLEEDPSTTVKAATIRSVSTRLGLGYRMLLKEYLKDSRWPVRAAAAGAGGLVSAIDDEDPRVAAAALGGMGERLADPEVINAVLAALTSDDLAVRSTAAGLLEEWPYPDKQDLLRQVLDRSTGVRWIELREQVRNTLEKLGEEVPEEGTTRTEFDLPSRTFETNPVVVLETSKGVMEIECFPGDAPIHVASFIQLVEDGLYDGLAWHRVVPNFVIQGGDPEGNGSGGPGYTIPDEINRRRYGRGAVGMPKLGKDTGGCQLFMTHIPTPHLDGNYTIFGQVVSGLDVIDRIEVGDIIVKATVQ